MSKKTILLLGCNSFIGTSFINEFKEDFIILCANIKTLDFELNQLIDKSDIIIHSIGVSRSKEDEVFFEVNFNFSFRIYTILSQKCNKLIFYFSSIHYNLNEMYGISKRYNEYLFSHISNNHSIIIRLPGIFGPGSKPNNLSVVSTFCYNIANNIPCNIIDPNKVIQLLYINDLFKLLIKKINFKNHNLIIKPSSTKIKVSMLYKTLNSFKFIEHNNIKLSNFEQKLFKTFNTYKQ